jgi:3-methylfumaryl-CoA hydratase
VADVDISLLRTWVGRCREEESVIEGSPAAAMAATLDHMQAPGLGAPLPYLWHWLYFTPRAPQSELGADGHPRLGDFMPPIPLPRRMWAGGRLRFMEPILVGESVRRETEILSVEHKSGRQGDLVFVTLGHRLHTERGLAIEEEQDLVYRAPGRSAEIAGRDPALPLDRALWRETLTPDPVLLFRYSALTFNAHRIHYDEPYATSEEGYPGIVVQGPLTATLLADRLLARAEGRLVEFSFRGLRPLFADAPLSLCGEAGEAPGQFRLWAESTDGATAMSATAQLHHQI